MHVANEYCFRKRPRLWVAFERYPFNVSVCYTLDPNNLVQNFAFCGSHLVLQYLCNSKGFLVTCSVLTWL